jgi:hypothetical protein
MIVITVLEWNIQAFAISCSCDMTREIGIAIQLVEPFDAITDKFNFHFKAPLEFLFDCYLTTI